MLLGMAMMFSLFAGLTLVFGANFLQNRDRLRALLIVIGTVLALIPLVIIGVSFFVNVWE
jgi:hypothetical protein